jgi:hypothetical protein
MSDYHNATSDSAHGSLGDDTTLAKLTIFISYVHEDFGIAGALNNAIQNAFGSDVAVFIDKVTIQQGENIRATIDASLAKSDILAVVSTGGEGARYWAGYEIGYFQASHTGSRPGGHPLWGNLVSFCSGNSPGPVAEDKYVTLGFDNTELEKSNENFGANLKIADDDPLLQWFGQLLEAIKCEKLEERKKVQDTFKSIIADFRKAVFAEFKRRPKMEFKPQKQLKIRFNLAPEHRFQIGDDAEITLTGNAHTVFGIPSQSSSRSLSWREFCDESAKAAGSLATFGTGTLVRVLARAGTDSLDEVSGNLIWSENEQKLYRLILTTFTTYYNRTIQANVYIVEVLTRKDHGDPETSLLAKGLQSAMRFRSLFLEQDGLFNYLNVELQRAGLATAAADIVAELDFLNVDLIAADVHKPASWNGILSPEEIKNMAGTWLPLKEKLLEDCRKAIAANDVAAVETAKSELAATLRDIGTKVGPLNDRCLRAIAAKLMDIADRAAAKRTNADIDPTTVAA